MLQYIQFSAIYSWYNCVYVQVNGFTIALPIKGDGKFIIEYLDKNLRIFKDPVLKSVVVQVYESAMD